MNGHYNLALYVGAAAAAEEVAKGKAFASLVVESLITPDKPVNEGVLIKSQSAVWLEIARKFGSDWSLAMQLTPEQWEEMIAGAYHRAGYEVILTPRSGDYGRDVIATTKGVGAVRILGSMKAYKLALQLPFLKISESMGNHDSKIVDADSVD